MYKDFYAKLKVFVVFTLMDIRKIDPKFYRHQLNEWQDKGYIKKLRRGYYMFSDVALDENALSLIANRLYAPSYVSFESALSYYGLIPEGVYSITSASSRKTAKFITPVAEFSYRQIKSALFFGYQIEQFWGQGLRIAEVEKAVLDYLYLNPRIVEAADFYEWRFNSEEFLVKANLTKLRKYAGMFKNKRFAERVEKFLFLVQSVK